MFDIEGEIQSARAAYRMRRFSEAMSSCRTILTVDAAHREAHEILALSALGNGDPAAAAAHLLRTAAARPHDWDMQLFAAVALVRCNRQDEAIDILEHAHARYPRETRIAFQLAVTLQSAKRLPEAIRYYRKSLRLAPKTAEIHNNLGTALSQSGEHDAALTAFTAALEIDPNYARALNNLGKELQELKRPEEAISPLERAIAIAPDSPEVRSNLGAAYKAAGRLEDAIVQYRHAIRLRPDLSQAQFNLGNTLLAAKRAAEAVGYLREAVRLMPQFLGAKLALARAYNQDKQPEASATTLRAALAQARDAAAEGPSMAERWDLALLLLEAADYFEAIAILQRLVDEQSPPNANLLDDFGQALAIAGSVLSSKPYLDRALLQFAAAIAADPLHALAQMHHGMLLSQQGHAQDAREHIERALALDPNLTVGWWQLASLRSENADWRDYPAMLRRLDELAEIQEAGIEPLLMAFLVDNPPAQLRCARRVSNSLRGSSGLLQALEPRAAQGPLKVAYLSPDFCAHPVGMSIVELLERHDPSRVEIHGISIGTDDSAYRRRIQAACRQFHDVTDLTNPEVARLLRDLGIDIAVDLAGHTAHCRPLMLAQRPAPINVQYLGFPGSMGASWMDYIIADPFVIPAEQFVHYDESVVWLPECFFPSDTTQLLPASILSRAAAGLPDDGVVFCAFNHFARIGPAQLDSWVRILLEVPDSVLWMRSGDAAAQENICREAAERGLDLERLIFAPIVQSRAEHLQRHRLADLYLDSYPYNGHSTGRDALWSDLPVLSRCGSGFASRVAGSLLTCLDMGDLITHDSASYEAAAIELGRDPARLADLKLRLQRNRARSTLFDTRRLASHLEDAYETMHRRWSAGEPRSPFAVPARPRFA